MAEDLDLKILLKAILDAKGFEDAQAAIKGLAGAANKTSKETAALGDETEKTTGEVRGESREIQSLTSVLLASIGMTRGNAAMAHASGVAYRFASDGATIFSLKLAGLTLGLSLLLPKIAEYVTENKRAAESQDQITESALGELPQLEELAIKLGKVNTALQEQVRAVRSQALRQQAKDIEENVSEIKKLEQAASDLQISIENLSVLERLMPSPGLMKRMNELRDDLQKQNLEIDRRSAILERQQEAQEKGLALERADSKALEESTEASKRAEEAKKKLKKAQEDLNEALGQGRRFVDQDALAKDSAAIAEMERIRNQGRLTDEQIEQLTRVGQTEEGIEAERSRLIKEREKDDREAAANKRALDAEILASSVSALTVFFGSNKAAMIAQAIVDTYAGATKAFAQGGVLGFVTSAAIIAQGLANVANIRKQEIGFDDPFSDLLAQKLGRKSAADFVKFFGIGFNQGMGGGGGTVNNYQSSTTINRGTSVGAVNYNSIVGARKTQQLKQLNRDLITIGRLEDRTRIGR